MINLSLSFCFYFSLGEPRPPPQGGFLQGAGSVYCVSSALKAPLFQKNSLSFSALGNALGGFGGKVATPGPWEAQAEVVAIALNQKVVDKFLKVCVEGEGARQGTQPKRPVSPLFPREVEQSPSFSSSMAENMICAEGGDPPSTAVASPIGYPTAS